MTIRTLIGASLALGAIAVAGHAAAPAKPAIAGMWDYQGRVAENQKIAEPPVTAAVKALLAKKRAMRDKGVTRSVANILCLPTGFPQMMQWKSPIEIFERPGRVAILSEHDPGNDEPRSIYLNRALPEEVDPSWNGYSVGKWDGPTLVVTTIGLNDRGNLFNGVPRTPTAKVVERFRVSTDGKTMTDEMTITDPAVLTGPWTVTLRYSRMPEDSERFEAVCEPDLEALKVTDLASLKETDVEAARLLDPTQQYNPGSR